MRGKFITFEGIDGAGKSTHVAAFAARLKARGLEVEVTREPGGVELAERLRELMLGSDMLPMTELLLAFAARHEHLQRRILPALDAGRWVICDRFTDSTYAYQGGGRGVDVARIASLEQWIQNGFRPDLTVLFDLPADEAARRRSQARQADRFEAEDLAFFSAVRAAYLKRVEDDAGRFVVIDSRASVSDIDKQLEKVSLSI